MQFEEQISSSGKSYYMDTITGKTQWGSKNFFNTKVPLPKGYICLILNGKDVYKYIGDHERLTSYSYSPPAASQEDTPDFDKTIISETYKKLQSLKTQPAINEMFRRLDLFENVAILLKRTPESIIDESLEFLSGKADVLPQTIIDYIQTTEIEQLGENASVTAFHTISQTHPSFSSERSIREICGLNMQEEELSRALEQLKDLNCGISLDLIHEPVMTGCANGHTCDKKSMKYLLETSIRRCPACNEQIPNTLTVTTLMPNTFAKKIIEEFVDKYVNQRGEIWNKITQTCQEYKDAKIIRQEETVLLRTERARVAEVAERARVEAERARVAREAEINLLPEREARLERDAERARVEAETARLAREEETGRLHRQREIDRLAREEFEVARVAREAERVRVREAEVARVAREAERVRTERVRLRLERETAERARVEAETARLAREIGQGNFGYREPVRLRREREQREREQREREQREREQND